MAENLYNTIEDSSSRGNSSSVNVGSHTRYLAYSVLDVSGRRKKKSRGKMWMLQFCFHQALANKLCLDFVPRPLCRRSGLNYL